MAFTPGTEPETSKAMSAPAPSVHGLDHRVEVVAGGVDRLEAELSGQLQP